MNWRRFIGSFPQNLYWFRVPSRVMNDLRQMGFHDGRSQAESADADDPVEVFFEAGRSEKTRRDFLEDWVSRIDRESLLMYPGFPSLWHAEFGDEHASMFRSMFGNRLVEICACRTDGALHRFRVSRWNFAVVYHVACMGNWHEVVDEQLSLLVEVGLTWLYATLLGTDWDRDWFLENCNRRGIAVEILFFHHDVRMYEIPAMRLIQDWAFSRDEAYVLYFHTKGVSRPGDPIKGRWRRLMNKWVIENWKENVELLRAGVDAVGVNWQNQERTAHFQGNFFMSKASFIRTLEDFSEYYRRPRYRASSPRNEHRLGPELWIGSGKGVPRIHSHVCADADIDQASFWERPEMAPFW